VLSTNGGSLCASVTRRSAGVDAQTCGGAYTGNGREDKAAPDRVVPLAAHELCAGLDAGAIAAFERLVQRKRFARGAFIVRAGESGQAMYLLVSGKASVVLTLPQTTGRGAESAELPAGGDAKRNPISVCNELGCRPAAALVDAAGSYHSAGDALLRNVQAPSNRTER